MDVKHDEKSDIYTFDFFYIGLNLTRYQAKQLVALIQEKCPELFVCNECQERDRLEKKEIDDNIKAMEGK